MCVWAADPHITARHADTDALVHRRVGGDALVAGLGQCAAARREDTRAVVDRRARVEVERGRVDAAVGLVPGEGSYRVGG